MSKPANMLSAIDTLESPDVFRQETLDAGFRNVKIQGATRYAFPVISVLKFRNDIAKGSALIQMMKKNMGEAAWNEKEALATRFPEEKPTELSARLSSDAWPGARIK